MKTNKAQTIESYIAAHSTPPSKVRQELYEATQKAKGLDADMQSGHLIGNLLQFLVKLSNARRVLEIGRFTGGSTRAIAEVLPNGASISTIDPDCGLSLQLAQRYWKEGAVRHRINPIFVDARAFLGGRHVIHEQNSYDLVFIDGAKEQYEEYWGLVVPLVRRGGIIVADDTLREGRILKPKRADDKAIDRFNKMVAKDPRVTVLMLPIGDGITIAVKK